jgi:hypothetical protein
MPEKTSACKNMAPPTQLKPKVWKSMRIRRFTVGDSVMIIANIEKVVLEHMFYETKNTMNITDSKYLRFRLSARNLPV